jgi:hypothetical protein
MSISCQQLYASVRGTIGVGAGNQLTIDRFTVAVNRALDVLSITADLATKHAHISGPESTITTLSSYYEWILSAGTAFYMIRLGQRPSDPALAQIVYKDTQTEWDRAKGDYEANIWNEEQATDSNSIIGLGYVG